MDQNKTQGQQQNQPNQNQPNQRQQTQGAGQGGQQNWNQGQTTQNPNREPAEGGRTQQMPGHEQEGTKRGANQQERGTGSQGERNRSSESDVSDRSDRAGGISNRSMDEELEEQSELPSRGDRQSDR